MQHVNSCLTDTLMSAFTSLAGTEKLYSNSKGEVTLERAEQKPQDTRPYTCSDLLAIDDCFPIHTIWRENTSGFSTDTWRLLQMEMLHAVATFIFIFQQTIPDLILPTPWCPAFRRKVIQQIHCFVLFWDIGFVVWKYPLWLLLEVHSCPVVPLFGEIVVASGFTPMLLIPDEVVILVFPVHNVLGTPFVELQLPLLFCIVYVAWNMEILYSLGL